MNRACLLYQFINTIRDKNLLTEFIKYIFEYQELHDYNYIFRIVKEHSEVIIDIYDNVSENRFNRYIFSYKKGEYSNGIIANNNNVFVTYIDVLGLKNSEVLMYKLGYMTTLGKRKIVEYAHTFLDDKYIEILKEIIKKPIS